MGFLSLLAHALKVEELDTLGERGKEEGEGGGGKTEEENIQDNEIILFAETLV